MQAHGILARLCGSREMAGAATLRQIAAELNALEIPASRGGEWSAVQVQRILQRTEAA